MKNIFKKLKKDKKRSTSVSKFKASKKVDLMESPIQHLEDDSTSSYLNNLSHDVSTFYFVNETKDQKKFGKTIVLHPDVVFLIEGIEANVLKNLSAVHFASFIGEIEKLQKLRNKGRDMNRNNVFKKTPLLYAIQEGNDECFDFLVNQPEVELENQNADDQSPFNLACQLGRTKMMQTLSNKGAGKESEDTQGKNISCITSQGTLEAYEENLRKQVEFYNNVLRSDADAIYKSVDKFESITFLTQDKQKVVVDVIIKLEDEDLLETCIQKGICIQKSHTQGDFLKEYLTNVYNSQQRELILIELLRTEKTFYDDILILMRLVEIFIQFVRTEMKGSNLLTVLSQISLGLKMIEDVNLSFNQKITKVMEQPYPEGIPFLTERHTEILQQFDILKLDYYLMFIQNLRRYEQAAQIEMGKDLFEEFMRKLEREIPEPRLPSFDKLLSRPRFRLIEYQNLMERVYKKISPDEEELKKSSKKAFDYIKSMLKKVNVKTDEIIRNNQMLDVGKIFETKYKMNIFQSQNRKYCFHIDKVKIHTNDKIYSSPIYAFSDAILFELGGKIQEFEFEKRKIVFCFHYGIAKIIIHGAGFEKYNSDTYIIFLKEGQNHMFHNSLKQVANKKFLIIKTDSDEFTKIREFCK